MIKTGKFAWFVRQKTRNLMNLLFGKRFKNDRKK